MPHKHKRRFDGDEEHFNLPPTIRAAPLPVSKGRDPNPAPRHNKKARLNPQTLADNGYGADDTPKAFSRLMAFKSRGNNRNGLDDGPKPKAKSKKPKNVPTKDGDAAEPGADDTVDSEAQVVQPKLTIQPGERLSEFAQRVNQALPLAGVNKNGKKIPGVRDHRVTRHEKKLKRLQKGWREEDARIKDKELEAQELAEEERDEVDAMWEDKTADLPSASGSGKKGSKKKGKRRLVAGEVDDKEDPWEALRKSREQRKGLHDVVQAPPTFDRIPREIFKVKNGAKVNTGNIPNKAGSLRKREELGEQRQTIIDTYRALMAAKRDN
ncbi:hypothetical protein K504DRAFT_471348 [Pleomassaria siparia CBS 279.74]|uniref:Uncharacterized protein n=1 Tax=Pleomassaria siparia CBS 279.74 TaxID=1314801 RepID=A0A6G1JZ71_9PLEO|nr:hypothetical protein K504DRAFT_471348 [Pleomassaria siparia CBS 279.74]